MSHINSIINRFISIIRKKWYKKIKTGSWSMKASIPFYGPMAGFSIPVSIWHGSKSSALQDMPQTLILSPSPRSTHRRKIHPSNPRRTQGIFWQASPRPPWQAPAPEGNRTAYRSAGLPGSGPGRRGRPPWIPGQGQVSSPARQQRCRWYYF